MIISPIVGKQQAHLKLRFETDCSFQAPARAARAQGAAGMLLAQSNASGTRDAPLSATSKPRARSMTPHGADEHLAGLCTAGSTVHNAQQHWRVCKVKVIRHEAACRSSRAANTYWEVH